MSSLDEHRLQRDGGEALLEVQSSEFGRSRLEPAVARTSRSRFVGRVCLVTGGGRGIGRAIAEALAAEGALVGVLSRTRAECETVVEGLGSKGLAIVKDVSNPGDCESAVRELETKLGPISLLVNAAGISPVRQRAEVHDLEAFRRILDINLIGTFAMARAAAPTLFVTRGAVVNVASVLGTVGSPRLAGYGAAKAGIVQLTRTLAREWADRGVRVNAVCPGFVATALTAEMLKVEHLRREVLEETPLGRLATAEEIVEPVLFLGSEGASYITGTTLVVDGGMSA